MSEVLRFTVEYEPPDETGAIVARVREVPSALSYGRTREEARANVLDALKLMLSPERSRASRRTVPGDEVACSGSGISPAVVAEVADSHNRYERDSLRPQPAA